VSVCRHVHASQRLTSQVEMKEGCDIITNFNDIYGNVPLPLHLQPVLEGYIGGQSWKITEEGSVVPVFKRSCKKDAYDVGD